MGKCKKVLDTAANMGRGRSNVVVTVNVTDIVKYTALAGVAIVGIIFGTRTWCEMKHKEDEEA